MPVSSMKDLLEAGVHFGHHTRKWDPKMKPYIYGARNDIYIIDLHKTRKKLEDAYDKVRQMAFQGKRFLFVGTKKQAQDAIKEAAESCEQFYVNHRWLGGMLTNWNTVQTRIDRLNQIDKMTEDGTLAKLVKKEQFRIMEERTKLDNILGGIRTMTTLPDVIFIIDCNKEHIAINEARKLDIPIVAVVDTNCNPDEIDIVIPGNDDAIRAVKLMASQMAEAINEGRLMAESVRAERVNQLGQAGAVSFGGGQIDFVGAEQVEFAPVSQDEDEGVFDEEMAKAFNISTRGSGGENVAVGDAEMAENVTIGAVTTTDQSFVTGGEVAGDAKMDGRDSGSNNPGLPDGSNEGGAAAQEVAQAVAASE